MRTFSEMDKHYDRHNEVSVLFVDAQRSDGNQCAIPVEMNAVQEFIKRMSKSLYCSSIP